MTGLSNLLESNPGTEHCSYMYTSLQLYLRGMYNVHYYYIGSYSIVKQGWGGGEETGEGREGSCTDSDRILFISQVCTDSDVILLVRSVQTVMLYY